MGATLYMSNGRIDTPKNYGRISDKARRTFELNEEEWREKNVFYVDKKTFKPTHDASNIVTIPYDKLYLAFMRLLAIYDTNYAVSLVTYERAKVMEGVEEKDIKDLEKFLKHHETTARFTVQKLVEMGERNGCLDEEHLNWLLEDIDYRDRVTEHLDKDFNKVYCRLHVADKYVNMGIVEINDSIFNDAEVKDALFVFIVACREANKRKMCLSWK